MQHGVSLFARKLRIRNDLDSLLISGSNLTPGFKNAELVLVLKCPAYSPLCLLPSCPHLLLLAMHSKTLVVASKGFSVKMTLLTTCTEEFNDRVLTALLHLKLYHEY